MESVPPWWIPISFSTAMELDITWSPLEECASRQPIYTLEVGILCLVVQPTAPQEPCLDAHAEPQGMSGLVLVPAQDDVDWLKLNSGQYGFYRVQYPEELWQRLTRVAARVTNDVPILPEVDFAGLLDDAWALNDAGTLPIHVFLNLTR
jgi:hypothetical protein